MTVLQFAISTSKLNGKNKPSKSALIKHECRFLFRLFCRFFGSKLAKLRNLRTGFYILEISRIK